jgi:superfamily II DNA or RNA helicase
MTDEVYFKYENGSIIKIYGNDNIQKLLYSTYRYKDSSYSVYNRSVWDGYHRLYNKKSYTFPIGLWYDAYQLIKKHYPNIKINISKGINLYNKDITLDIIESYVKTLCITIKDSNNNYNKITPYSHQIKALYEYAVHGRYTMLSATSSGKSLIAYLIIRYARDIQGLDNFLLLAPTTSLVDQMYLNFEEYSYNDNGFDISLVQRIYSSRTKNLSNPIVVSTWQSLQNLEKGYFKEFEFLFVDECHTADAKKLTKISNNCINAVHRIGATGTLKNNDISKMLVTSLFGYSIKIIDAKKLIDKGQATPLIINMISLWYPDELLTEYKELIKSHKNKYQKEIEFVVSSAERRSWLSRFVDSLEGNTLVLFDRKDTHLYEDMETLKSFSDKDVYIISGDVKLKDRNNIKRKLEESNNNVLGATFGTFQLGESVNNLHNLVLALGGKSNIRTLQSIGRMMRKHSTKELSNIFDIVDIIDPNSFNYLLDHSMARLQYFIEEGHSIKLDNIYL